jgi:RND superfamily putative drug exporter
MVALALPLLGVRFTQIDASVLPETTSARQVDDALRHGFNARRTTPITLVARTAPGRALSRYLDRVRTVSGVARVASPQAAGPGLMLVDVVSRAGPLGAESQATVRRLRALPSPFPVLTRGETAAFIDSQQSMARHLPAALLIVAATTMLVLFIMTGSLLLPIKAMVMNLLTLAAALGLLVLIFQGGHLHGLLAYSGDPPLATSLMIFLAAVAFGLSTDYGVFLLARIKEARDDGAPNQEAVALGLQRTGRLVTAAATLFCVAIGAFATSDIVFIKQLGLGTALAVLIDATIVRALLVPALMQLLGERNWWAPRPIASLRARLGQRASA